MRGLKKYLFMLMACTLATTALSSCNAKDSGLNLENNDVEAMNTAEAATKKVVKLLDSIYKNEISYTYEVASSDFTDNLVNVSGDGFYKIQRLGIDTNTDYYPGTITQIFKISDESIEAYMSLSNEKVPSILKYINKEWGMRSLDINLPEKKEAFKFATSEYTGPGSDYTLPDELEYIYDALSGKGTMLTYPSDIKVVYDTNGILDVLSFNTIIPSIGKNLIYTLSTDYNTFLKGSLKDGGDALDFTISFEYEDLYNEIKEITKGIKAKEVKSYDYVFDLFDKYNEIGTNATNAYLEAHPELNN